MKFDTRLNGKPERTQCDNGLSTRLLHAALEMEPIKFFGDQYSICFCILGHRHTNSVPVQISPRHRYPSKRTGVLDFVLTYFARKLLPIETAHSYLKCVDGHVFGDRCRVGGS